MILSYPDLKGELIRATDPEEMLKRPRKLMQSFANSRRQHNPTSKVDRFESLPKKELKQISNEP